MMKILFVNKFFYMKGGAERVFFQERKYLIDQGIEIVDFSMHDPKNVPSLFNDFFVPNIDYHNSLSIKNKIHHGFSLIHSKEAVERLEKLIIAQKPDIAHLHNIYHQLTPSIIPVLKKHNIKVIVTLHDYKLICPNYVALNGNNDICLLCNGKYFWNILFHNCQNSYPNSFLLMIEACWHKWKKSYDIVDLFISPSQFLASKISSRIPSKKIKILFNGIEINEYQPRFSDNGYGLFFGRVSKEKGIETLLKANDLLSVENQLFIIGTGPKLTELRRSYPHATFLGYKSGEELKNLIAGSAFVVVSSEWYENCSMVVLEAMALGKSVIASNIGGIPEQVDNGKTGFLFKMGNVKELAEMMNTLYKDKNLRKKMGKTARKKIESKYSADVHNQKLMKIYQEFLKSCA